MKLKLMNVMGQATEVEITGNPVQIDVTVLSGDEILEVFYLGHVEVYDVAKLLGLPARSVDSFGGRHTVYIRNRLDLVDEFNMRRSITDTWWA